MFQKGGKRVKHIYVGEKVGGTGSYLEAESVSCEVPALPPQAAEGGLPNILRLFLGESVNCHSGWQCEVPALRIPAVEPEGGGASGAY